MDEEPEFNNQVRGGTDESTTEFNNWSKEPTVRLEPDNIKNFTAMCRSFDIQQ